MFKHLEFDNLNLSQTFSETFLKLLRNHPNLFCSLEKLSLAPIRVEKSQAGDLIID